MERRSGSPKPGHSLTNDRAKAGKPSFSSAKDDPLATAGVDSKDAHEHQPRTGDRNAVSVTERGSATVRTNTPAPHAGETEAPVDPPDGETPAMARPVKRDRNYT
jgi:hypothetical protein